MSRIVLVSCDDKKHSAAAVTHFLPTTSVQPSSTYRGVGQRVRLGVHSLSHLDHRPITTRELTRLDETISSASAAIKLSSQPPAHGPNQPLFVSCTNRRQLQSHMHVKSSSSAEACKSFFFFAALVLTILGFFLYLGADR